MTTCPVCVSPEPLDTVRRERLPAMQNYVYRTREDALAAQQGTLTLAVCRLCGFAWNRAFDPGRLVYDDGYDNAVPSAVMGAYYQKIVAYLRERYDLEGGLIVDVGCGDGAFLRTICAAIPGSRGLGVDPALDEEGTEADGRIVLVKDVFTSALISEQPSLILSRHVLEHIPDPVSFLREIGEAVGALDPVPCFFEVPDLDWIVENRTFWDLCYEHCNYFTAASFGQAVSRAGLELVGTRTGFGSQYLWVEATTRGGGGASAGGENGEAGIAKRAQEYATSEAARIRATRERILALKREGAAIAVWGMATKGVLLSSLVDPDASIIDFCIDANPNKQGCFVPLTGHEISPPEALCELGEKPLAVLVMNENYREEIRHTCLELGLDASFITMGAQTYPAGVEAKRIA